MGVLHELRCNIFLNRLFSKRSARLPDGKVYLASRMTEVEIGSMKIGDSVGGDMLTRGPLVKLFVVTLSIVMAAVVVGTSLY